VLRAFFYFDSVVVDTRPVSGEPSLSLGSEAFAAGLASAAQQAGWATGWCRLAASLPLAALWWRRYRPPTGVGRAVAIARLRSVRSRTCVRRSAVWMSDRLVPSCGIASARRVVVAAL